MKILESQNALLSNYEVYQHLVDQQRNNKVTGRKVPGNLATLRTEVITYLREKPGPLANQEQTQSYNQNSATVLLEKIRDAKFPTDIAKGEFLQILNMRPSSSAQLSAVIEDMEDRFTEEDQNRLIDIIADVLGRDEPAQNGTEDENAMESIETGN